MTKVIENIDLLKKLQPYLEDMEAEYVYFNIFEDDLILWTYGLYWSDYIQYKTLTLEEAINFLWLHKIVFTHIYIPTLENIHTITDVWYIENNVLSDKFVYWDEEEWYFNMSFGWKILLKVIEELLEYLDDNNLLENE